MTRDAGNLWRWIKRQSLATRYFETIDEDAACDLIETGLVRGVERRPGWAFAYIKMEITKKGWDEILSSPSKAQ